jgi:hypothetical protein
LNKVYEKANLELQFIQIAVEAEPTEKWQFDALRMLQDHQQKRK